MDRGWSPNLHVSKLGNPRNPWENVYAKTAEIEAFKNKGTTSKPVYFDKNGIPQPVNEVKADTAKTAEEAKTGMGLSVVNGLVCITYNT